LLHQYQTLLGTLLGSSKIEISDDGYHLAMRSTDPYWLRSKVHDLEIGGQFFERGQFYYWRSAPSKVLKEAHAFCYEGKKKVVSMEWLDMLRDIGIAVWYGDVGCLVGRAKGNACLRTQAFGEDNQLICQYFNEVGIPCNINKVRGKPVIVFAVDGTHILMNLVAPVLPLNRYHLVPELVCRKRA